MHGMSKKSELKIIRWYKGFKHSSRHHHHVFGVCPLQPSSSANPDCPGPESSVSVSSWLACPITSQVTDHWGEPCNRTGEVHPVDPFHSLDNLKNQFVFCRNSAVYNVRNGAVIKLPVVVYLKGFPRHW